MSDFNVEFEEQDQVITLEFEQAGGGAVRSVNGKVGEVVLDAADVGAYVKPSGGIPKTDLASAVQTSLGKADSAYQKPSGGIPATDMASGAIPTVDSTLAISGAAADAKKTGDEIATVKNDLDDLETALSTKAEVDGYYESMTVGNAEQLVATVGIEDKVPYLFRTSGGSVDIGDREVDKIVGGTIAWNQMASAISTVNYDKLSSGDTLTINDGEATISMTANYGGLKSKTSSGHPTDIAGHKYFISADIKSSEANDRTGFGISKYDSSKSIRKKFSVTTSYANYAFIGQQTTETVPQNDVRFMAYDETGAGRTLYVKNVQIFDLTQMFGSTIADYIYSLEQANAGAGVAWFKKLFPKDYYQFDAGTLKSVEGLSAHSMVGFNQWDEEWELGVWSGSGTKVASNTAIRSKNYIPVLPSTVYYCCFGSRYTSGLIIRQLDASKQFLATTTFTVSATFTTLADCRYIVLCTYGDNNITTYKNDICINLSWSGYRNGEYEAYKKWTYPLDSDLVLRGIPKLDSNNALYYDGDTYESDGTVTRRYAIATFDGSNDEIWGGTSTSGWYVTLNSLKKSLNYKDVILCNLYETNAYNKSLADNYVSGYADNYNNYPNANWLYYTNSTLSTKADLLNYLSEHPFTVVYELATPTTETEDPYQNPQVVDDFGTEEYVTTSIVPVGHETFYPENLRKKIEKLPWDFSTLIAPTEKTYTATRNYTTGSLLIVNNILYKATANIANGGTITPNSNVTATTLAEVISALA